MASIIMDKKFIQYNEERIQKIEQEIEHIKNKELKRGEDATALNEAYILLEYYKKNIRQLKRERSLRPINS